MRPVIDVNTEPDALSRRLQHVLRGPAGEILPQLVAAVSARLAAGVWQQTPSRSSSELQSPRSAKNPTDPTALLNAFEGIPGRGTVESSTACAQTNDLVSALRYHQSLRSARRHHRRARARPALGALQNEALIYGELIYCKGAVGTYKKDPRARNRTTTTSAWASPPARFTMATGPPRAPHAACLKLNPWGRSLAM